jgi:ankyrin repeat protein
MLAASNDHAETVSLLLERGADMNHAEATGGWTALIWAAKRGHVRSVEVLLAHGADPGLTDLSGRRAIDYARENGHIPVIRSLNGMPLSPADH